METYDMCYAHVDGMCQLMCAEKEFILRQSQKRIHYFEKEALHDGRLVGDRRSAVKEYSRPAAGKSDPIPSDLRPASVLQNTVTYLIRRIMPREDRPFHRVYEFVFDRLRAVRQDLTIQRLADSSAVCLLERIIQVMLYAHYRLCEEPLMNFDPVINRTHLQECLKRLLVLYEKSGNCHCRMSEFAAFYLLFNLGSSEALKYCLEKKHQLGGSSTFSLAVAIGTAWLKCNYVRVKRLSRLLPVLHMCAVHASSSQVTRTALEIMSSSYNSKNLVFPLSHLINLLDLDSAQTAESLCRECGLEIIQGKGVKFLKPSFNHESKLPRYGSTAIEEDLSWEDIPELLLGQPCQCVVTAVTQ